MKNILLKFGAWSATLPILLLPAATYAQLSESVTKLDQVKTGLGDDATMSLPELIGNIIRVALGVIGIFLVIQVIYSGYLYMTDKGDAKNVDTAKKRLGTAVIGIIIIVAAYAISEFVLAQIIAATSGTAPSV